MNSPARISKQIDVIIPCFNAASTLAQAVQSALKQAAVSQVWVVNDGSTDDSEALAQTFEQQMPERVKLLNMPKNSGAAMARNWAAMHVKQPYIAFLDADDVYEDNALDAVAVAFDCLPELAMVRLALKPWGMPESFTEHPGFSKAWRSCEMTGAGNVVMSRHVFLGAGGFPMDGLFKKFGGEDVALGLALHDSVMVGRCLINRACCIGIEMEATVSVCLMRICSMCCQTISLRTMWGRPIKSLIQLKVH